MQGGAQGFESKLRDARWWPGAYLIPMTNIDPSEAWAAVMARDRRADGRFVTGVLSTGIYCRPSCAARHPKRENVRFFADGAGARSAGLRPCLRCRPDDVADDERGVARAIALIEASDDLPTLDILAEAAGYSPYHFHRLFKRGTGVTPAAYARAVRARRAEAALKSESSVTAAIYGAGYAAPSRFYADARDRLGMTPSAWRAGGKGVTIRWAIAETDLGPLLVAATEKGICRVAFAEDAQGLRSQFPEATIEPGGPDFRALLDSVARFVAAPGLPMDLPLDVRGTAFQEAVWRALAEVPAGSSVSYAALAASVGSPGATRAAGSACGKNPVAILIPCHRAKRGDGTAGGYAWGLARKAALLAREQSL